MYLKRFLLLLFGFLTLHLSPLPSSVKPLLEFQLSPEHPLHIPYMADPFNTDFALNVLFLESEESRPAYLYKVQGEGEALIYEGYDIDQYYSKGTTLIQMRTGTVIPVGRLTFNGGGFFPSLSVEGVFKGGFRSIFFAYSGTDLLGLDGTYFYGLNAKLGEFLTFSYGRKHHSAHVGDEILLRVEDNVAHEGSLFDNALIDYVRQDPITYAISFNPLPHLRFYGELRMGDTGRILKPRLATESTLEDGYRGRELQIGVEVSTPVKLLGDFTLALDLVLHESGKFIPLGSGEEKNGEYQRYMFVYDEAAPWEYEFNILLSQSLTPGDHGMQARLQVVYHKGRFPLFAFHMSKGSYIAVGASFSY